MYCWSNVGLLCVRCYGLNEELGKSLYDRKVSNDVDAPYLHSVGSEGSHPHYRASHNYASS